MLKETIEDGNEGEGGQYIVELEYIEVIMSELYKLYQIGFFGVQGWCHTVKT